MTKLYPSGSFAAGEVYWAIVDGTTIEGLLPDAKRWIHLVSRRLRPSGNHTYVIFPRALVLAYAIHVISLNIGVQIISECKKF